MNYTNSLSGLRYIRVCCYLLVRFYLTIIMHDACVGFHFTNCYDMLMSFHLVVCVRSCVFLQVLFFSTPPMWRISSLVSRAACVYMNMPKKGLIIEIRRTTRAPTMRLPVPAKDWTRRVNTFKFNSDAFQRHLANRRRTNATRRRFAYMPTCTYPKSRATLRIGRKAYVRSAECGPSKTRIPAGLAIACVYDCPRRNEKRV